MSTTDEFLMPDRVAETFTDQVIMITGGTGFMGKVLVEKLLRKCSDMRQIILLVRNKKGKDPNERLDVMLNDPLFGQVLEQCGLQRIKEKIKVVCGDVSEPDLGMSENDRLYIQSNVDIIVHAAATIRFDEALKKAVLLNVRGTKLILELGKTCKNLKLFIHISTAYCHLHEKVLEERAYDPPADPHKVLSTVEVFDDETIDKITPTILDKVPNSYAFTKALGEALAVEAMKDMPVMILRPSIGAGKGVLRSMYCRSDSYADYLPVDIFINGIMVVAWNYLKNRDSTTMIYNFTSSAEVKVTWSELIDTGRDIVLNRIPLNGVVWYPGGSMKHSRLAHNICALLFHWIPAILVDTLLFILRFDPVLIRVHKRISKGFDVFEYYTNNQWDFKSEAGQRVRARLNAREKEDYKVDADGANIPDYFEDCVRAARRYVLKEDDDTIPAAKRHMRLMRVVDILFRYLFMGFVFWTLARMTLNIFDARSDQLNVI